MFLHPDMGSPLHAHGWNFSGVSTTCDRPLELQEKIQN